MWRGEWSLHVFPKIKKYTFTALSLSPRAKRRFRFRFLPGMLPGSPGYPVPSMVPSPLDLPTEMREMRHHEIREREIPERRRDARLVARASYKLVRKYFNSAK
jgi:hypothetical protein